MTHRKWKQLTIKDRKQNLEVIINYIIINIIAYPLFG